MACTEKKPKKGILKNSSSFDKTEHHLARKEMKWDEMNIIATHHPPDKDYGHMKIDEPPTPYSKYTGSEDEDGVKRRGSFDPHSEDEHDGLDPVSIASKLEDDKTAKVLRHSFNEDDDSDSDEERNETEEERAERKAFEKKRKLHYNEFQAMKLAKQLMEEEEDEDDLVDEEAAKNARVNARPSLELCMDGETSMEGVSSTTHSSSQDGSSVDRPLNTANSNQ